MPSAQGAARFDILVTAKTTAILKIYLDSILLPKIYRGSTIVDTFTLRYSIWNATLPVVSSMCIDCLRTTIMYRVHNRFDDCLLCIVTWNQNTRSIAHEGYFTQPITDTGRLWQDAPVNMQSWPSPSNIAHRRSYRDSRIIPEQIKQCCQKKRVMRICQM